MRIGLQDCMRKDAVWLTCSAVAAILVITVKALLLVHSLSLQVLIRCISLGKPAGVLTSKER